MIDPEFQVEVPEPGAEVAEWEQEPEPRQGGQVHNNNNYDNNSDNNSDNYNNNNELIILTGSAARASGPRANQSPGHKMFLWNFIVAFYQMSM